MLVKNYWKIWKKTIKTKKDFLVSQHSREIGCCNLKGFKEHFLKVIFESHYPQEKPVGSVGFIDSFSPFYYTLFGAKNTYNFIFVA